MTASELATKALENSGYQVTKAFEGLAEAAWDKRANDQSMTPREMAGHLCECYHAMLEKTEGREHEWGTYTPPSTSSADLVGAMTAMRAEAVGKALASGDDGLTAAMDYLALHDAYHVGQLVSLRMGLDPDWNAYSIYNF